MSFKNFSSGVIPTLKTAANDVPTAATASALPITAGGAKPVDAAPPAKT